MRVGNEPYYQVETLEGRSRAEKSINNHRVWYHVLEHSASHMGHISLVKARMPQ